MNGAVSHLTVFHSLLFEVKLLDIDFVLKSSELLPAEQEREQCR